MPFSPLTMQQAKAAYANAAFMRYGEFAIFSMWQEVRYFACGQRVDNKRYEEEAKKAMLMSALNRDVKEHTAKA